MGEKDSRDREWLEGGNRKAGSGLAMGFLDLAGDFQRQFKGRRGFVA
jgi:hypothetical protein